MKPINNVFFENILTREECDAIHHKYLNYIKDGWEGYEHDRRLGISIADPFKNLGFDDEMIVTRITPLIEKNFEDKIKYSHSYARLYRNGAILLPHTDREGLDITLTVNLGGLETWPIHISNIGSDKVVNIQKEEDAIGLKYKEDYVSFLTPKGCGIVCYACNYAHWRDRLVCNDDEYVLQIFYHWTIIK